jgi:hypothetical protein
MFDEDDDDGDLVFQLPELDDDGGSWIGDTADLFGSAGDTSNVFGSASEWPTGDWF